MAEMMEALTRRLEFAFLGGRFWTFAQVGGVIVLLTSFSPYFVPYNVTALVVLACAITWDLWRNAPKSVRYLLGIAVLGAFVFLLYNTLGVFYGWWPAFHHPSEAAAPGHGVDFLMGLAAADPVAALTALGEFTQSVILAALAYVGGAFGQLFFLVSGLMGVLAARRAE